MAKTDTKIKSYEIGDKLNKYTKESVGWIPNLNICPHCHSNDFKWTKAPNALVCSRCNRIMLLLKEKPETETKTNQPLKPIQKPVNPQDLITPLPDKQKGKRKTNTD